MALATTEFEEVRLDWFGVLCSFGCAIHCAAMPLLIATLPSLTSIQWLADPLFHQVVAVLCGVLVVRAILPGFQVHRDQRVVALAGIGMALLFVAAFVLPDACCSGISNTANLESSAPTTATAKIETSYISSKIASSKIVLVSVRESWAAKFGTVDNRATEDHCVTCTHDHNHEATCDHNLTGGHLKSGACEEAACEHPSTLSRPLLSAVELESRLGPALAHPLIAAQPYLSPLGGVFLILAHVLNIRLRGCNRVHCCDANA